MAKPEDPATPKPKSRTLCEHFNGLRLFAKPIESSLGFARQPGFWSPGGEIVKHAACLSVVDPFQHSDGAE